MSHVFIHTFKYIGALLTLTHSNALLPFHNHIHRSTSTLISQHTSLQVCFVCRFPSHSTLSFPESPRACHLPCHSSVKHRVALATSPVSSACDPLLWGMTSLVKMTIPWVDTKSCMMVVQAVYSPKPRLTPPLSLVTVTLFTEHFIPHT